MRIDRFLHCIRLVKSRTLAQKLIEEGYIRIDRRRVEKPSEEVTIGNVIAFPLRGEIRILKVLKIPEGRRPSQEALLCYEEISQAGN